AVVTLNYTTPYFVRYTFVGSNIGDPLVEFDFTNWSNAIAESGTGNAIRYRVNGGAWQTPTGQVYTDLGGNNSDEQVVFDPVEIATVGGYTLRVGRLVRDERNTRT